MWVLVIMTKDKPYLNIDTEQWILYTHTLAHIE